MVMVSVMLSYIVTSDSMGTLQKRLSLCRRTLIKLSPGHFESVTITVFVRSQRKC